MPETCVRYARPGGGRTEMPIRFVGPDANFLIETERIERRMTAGISPRLLDLLEIAASIFCADATFSRGSPDQPKHGQTWRRHLDFTFIVRDRQFWDQLEIKNALRETVEFMTGDRFDCSFVEADQSANISSYFDFGEDAAPAFQIDDVILFSGGLDSLTGTLKTLSETDKRIALVTHMSAQKTISRQTELIKQLQAAFPDRFLWVPIKVHRRKQRAKESTQRSRSLLFAALGSVVARMLGATRLQFFENGVVSQNLALAPPIVGTLATRTTHPQTLKLLQSFLSQVAGDLFEVHNPFEWQTKSDVVQTLSELKFAHLLPQTVSCNHVFARTAVARHCGSCSQCLDRRFAVLANGLERYEKSEDYETDVLFGVRERDDERALTVEWVRHARQLAAIEQAEFMSEFMGEVIRVSQPYPDANLAIQNSHDMHRRHGRSVVDVMTRISSHDLRDAPNGSLAAIFNGLPKREAEPSPAINDQGLTQRTEARDQYDLEGRVLELRRRNDNEIEILGLQDFNGAKARLIVCLMKVLEQDRKSGLPLAQFRTLRAKEIADVLDVSEDYVRQEVKRIRAELKDSWFAIHGTAPRHDALIRTIGKKGYRLNSTVNVVSQAIAN